MFSFCIFSFYRTSHLDNIDFTEFHGKQQYHTWKIWKHGIGENPQLSAFDPGSYWKTLSSVEKYFVFWNIDFIIPETEYCTKWPEELNDVSARVHFPLEFTQTDYIHSSPSIRDARARVVTLKVCPSFWFKSIIPIFIIYWFSLILIIIIIDYFISVQYY